MQLQVEPDARFDALDYTLIDDARTVPPQPGRNAAPTAPAWTLRVGDGGLATVVYDYHHRPRGAALWRPAPRSSAYWMRDGWFVEGRIDAAGRFVWDADLPVGGWVRRNRERLARDANAMALDALLEAHARRVDPGLYPWPRARPNPAPAGVAERYRVVPMAGGPGAFADARLQWVDRDAPLQDEPTRREAWELNWSTPRRIAPVSVATLTRGEASADGGSFAATERVAAVPVRDGALVVPTDAMLRRIGLANWQRLVQMWDRLQEIVADAAARAGWAP